MARRKLQRVTRRRRRPFSPPAGSPSRHELVATSSPRIGESLDRRARSRCRNPRQAGRGALSPGKSAPGPAKAYLSRQNRDFLRCGQEGLTVRLDNDRRRDSRKPRRNDEVPRDAGRTGAAGSYRPARRRYRRRVQLRPDPDDQRAEHLGAFLTRGTSVAAGCAGRAHALEARPAGPSRTANLRVIVLRLRRWG